MSRGPEGEPRVSGRVESPAPRPDTATARALSTVSEFMADCALAALVLAVCLFVAPLLASLV